jgi:hypothetical protein
MGWFKRWSNRPRAESAAGKAKLREADSAVAFVAFMRDQAQENWPLVADAFELVGCHIEVPRQKGAHELWIAATFIQMQAIDNLFPVEQARRLRKHVIDAMSSVGESTQGTEAINQLFDALRAYSPAWANAGDSNRLPHELIGEVLIDRLNVDCMIAVGTKKLKVKNPYVVGTISAMVLNTGMGAWKLLKEKFELIR